MACLIFDHIPKTAGTTFQTGYLKRALPAAARWIVSGGTDNEQDRKRYFELSEEERKTIRVIAGHYADSFRPLLPDARFITVIRDPLSRTVSAYLHARLHPGGDALWPDLRREQLPLTTYVARYHSVVDDYQSRCLLGDDCASLDDAAIAVRLDERYALVGYTEAFDSFVFMLHVREGLPLSLYTNRLVRAESATYRPSEEDVAAVEACTTVDARLHRIVRTRFDEALASLPGPLQDAHATFVEDLERFRLKKRQRRAVADSSATPAVA